MHPSVDPSVSPCIWPSVLPSIVGLTCNPPQAAAVAILAQGTIFVRGATATLSQKLTASWFQVGHGGETVAVASFWFQVGLMLAQVGLMLAQVGLMLASSWLKGEFWRQVGAAGT